MILDTVFAVAVIAFGLGTVEDCFEFFDTFADCVDGVVLLLEICGKVVIELHIYIVEVVFPACFQGG